MSTLKVNKITGTVDFINDVKVQGGGITVNFTADSAGAVPDSSTASRGDFFYDNTNDILQFFTGPSGNSGPGAGWKNVGLTDSSGWPVPPSKWYGNRWLHGGGTYNLNSPYWYHTSTISYGSINTTGNATSFGSLTQARSATAAVSNEVTGVFAGGSTYSYPTWTMHNTIDYVSFATTGNASDFGDMSETKYRMGSVAASTGKGFFVGGSGASYADNTTAEYVTISTPGNAVVATGMTIGSAVNISSYGNPAAGEGTYSLHGDAGGTDIEKMNLHTIGTAAVDFGSDTANTHQDASACSDDTYWATQGGSSGARHISRATFATNASNVDFGDLQQNGGEGSSATSDVSTSRCLVTGRYWIPYHYNHIEYYDITTTSNASDYGDLVTNSRQGAATSGAS